MAEEKPERILKIARLLNRYKDEKGRELLPFISSSLKVSGRTIGKVGRMIEDGLITFDDHGEPSFTMPYESIREIKARQEASKARQEIAQRTVEGVIRRAIVAEAKARTEQYLVLGKAIRQAHAVWAAKKGMSPQDIKRTPIHKVIATALEKEADYDRLKQSNSELREALELSRLESDPIVRLRNAGALMTRFIELALTNEAVEEALGVQLLNLEPAARHFNRILTKYIVGG